MAVHLDYNTDKRIIFIMTAPVAGTLSLNGKIDIYSDMKEDWRTNPALNRLRFPLSAPVGGNTIDPITGKAISPYYFLKYGWRMRPYEADHTLYIQDSYVLVDGGGDPWLKTLGGYTVNIRDSVPADSFTTTVSVGSGLSPEEQAKLDELWRLRGLKAGETLDVQAPEDGVPGHIKSGDIDITLTKTGTKTTEAERQ